MRHLCIVIVALLLEGLTIASRVQDGASEPSFRGISSELVVLPVVVTDKQGRLISDLPRDRFTVLDNGRTQTISIFTNEDTPVTMGIVLDSSGSMRSKLGEVVAAGLALARSSNPQDDIFLIEFNDRVRAPLPDRKMVLANDLDALETALTSLSPQGRTALYDALIAAMDRLDEGRHARKVLVLMSDGGDNASQATLAEVLARARRSNTAFYTIGLFEANDVDSNPRVLKALAETTGGERFLPRSPGLLIQACQHIAREIRSGYTIGYEPPARDGTYHRVEVRVRSDDGRQLGTRTRPGYFAAAEGAAR